MRRFFGLVLLVGMFGGSLLGGEKAEFLGGTVVQIQKERFGTLETADQEYLAFYAKHERLRIPYSQVNLIEYGQKADRRVVEAIVISPMFLLSKSRKHFLTIGFTDDLGRQQAVLFRIDKKAIRTMLVSLEARTGLKVQFQDPEARKGGKG